MHMYMYLIHLMKYIEHLNQYYIVYMCKYKMWFTALSVTGVHVYMISVPELAMNV